MYFVFCICVFIYFVFVYLYILQIDNSHDQPLLHVGLPIGQQPNWPILWTDTSALHCSSLQETHLNILCSEYFVSPDLCIVFLFLCVCVFVFMYLHP